MTDLELVTGAGRLIVRGLQNDECGQLVQDWSRCLRTVPEDDGREPQTFDRGSVDWSTFQEQLVFAATRSTILSGQGASLMFHGAGLAQLDTAHAVALVAASGTGKTTATRFLGQHLGYLTDETVVVDPESLAITPFPKPLSILGPEGNRPKAQLGPDELGLLAAPDGARLAALCILDRNPDHVGDPVAEKLTLQDALALLLPQTSSLAQLGRGLVQLAQLIDRLGGVHRLTYAESAELLPLVNSVLDGAPDRTREPSETERTWEPAPENLLKPHQRPSAAGPRPEGAIRRLPVDDALDFSDGSLGLLHSQQYSVIHGLGPVLWELTGQWTTLDELTEQLTADGAAPPEADRLIESAVGVLIADHLLERP